MHEASNLLPTCVQRIVCSAKIVLYIFQGDVNSGNGRYQTQKQ
jgi:hypothetical protein